MKTQNICWPQYVSLVIEILISQVLETCEPTQSGDDKSETVIGRLDSPRLRRFFTALCVWCSDEASSPLLADEDILRHQTDLLRDMIREFLKELQEAFPGYEQNLLDLRSGWQVVVVNRPLSGYESYLLESLQKNPPVRLPIQAYCRVMSDKTHLN